MDLLGLYLLQLLLFGKFIVSLLSAELVQMDAALQGAGCGAPCCVSVSVCVRFYTPTSSSLFYFVQHELFVVMWRILLTRTRRKCSAPLIFARFNRIYEHFGACFPSSRLRLTAVKTDAN